MAHTIQNNMSVKQNTITIPTSGTYVTQDIVIRNNVDSGSFTNAPVNGQTYTEDTTANTVLPAGGYLYINKGWHDNTKISLGHLIPDIADNDAGQLEMRDGFKAYDENGKVITGTMVDVTPTFTGGAVTATASGSVDTAPKVTINPLITDAASTTFGMRITAPSTGTEGTDYIKIDATGVPSDGTVTAKANASRTAVLYETAEVGYLNVAANTTASGAASATENTATVIVTPTVTDDFAARYIPVVKSQTFGGGTITTGTPTVSGSNPTFTTAISASSSASTYGLTSTAISGTEGTNYIKFTPTGTPGTSQTKSVSIPVNRAAVTVSNSAGVIAAKDGVAIEAGSTNATASVSVQAVAGTATPQYMPIVSVSGSGGGVTGTASAQIASYPTVTVRNIASDNASTYGFTNTQPSSGTYVSITGDYGAENGVVRPIATATRAAVTYTNTAGAIAAHSGSQLLTAADKTLTGSDLTVKTNVIDTNLKNYYVPVATIKAVPDAPDVNVPTMTRTVSVSATGSQSTSGVLSSAPSSGNYLTITPSTTVIKGSATSVASAATNSAGVVSTSTTSPSVRGTASAIDVSVTSTSSKYIKIYDGTYTIS